MTIRIDQNGKELEYVEHDEQRVLRKQRLCEIHSHNAEKLQAIHEIEIQITPRRVREAALTEDGFKWLLEKNSQIENIRKEMLNDDI